MSPRAASFFISISDCHCVYFFGRTGDQTLSRTREALEISYAYRDLAKALTDVKENLKKRKKENNLNEGNTQYKYEKRRVWKWKYSTLRINVDSF